MAKKSLQRYLAKIKKDYNVSLTEENYKDIIILKELESPPSLLEYLLPGLYGIHIAPPSFLI
jgi:hypothetical protein